MRRFGWVVLFAPVLMAVMLLAARPAAAALSTYHFSGVCALNDCATTGEGDLVLTGYTGGTINPSNFVSFTYLSSILNLNFGVSDLTSILGDLSIVPGPATVQMHFFDGTFDTLLDSFTDGSWSMDLCLNCNPADFGANHTWSLEPIGAPEPASLALLGAGLVALGFARRRRAG